MLGEAMCSLYGYWVKESAEMDMPAVSGDGRLPATPAGIDFTSVFTVSNAYRPHPPDCMAITEMDILAFI